LTQITEDAILIEGKPKYSVNPFIEYIKVRCLDKNKNFMGFCIGSTGSGKSYTIIRAAEIIDPDFNIDHIVFSVKEFMQLLNSGTLKRGSVIMFDEAGVGIPKKMWYSLSNKLFNFILQTYRWLNLVVFFTSPEMNIDSDSLKLFHCLIETTRIDLNENMSYAKPMMIDSNYKTHKTYFKYLRVTDGERTDKLTEVGFKLANKDLLEKYEAKKRAFSERLNKRVEAEVTKIEYDQDDIVKSILNEKQKQVYNYVLKGYKPTQIAQLMNMTIGEVMTKLRTIKDKGFTISWEK